MSTCILTTGRPRRIGFISTRFHGTDGVTLEARKWALILEDMGHTCFWMAGLLDAPTDIGHPVPLAYFQHPEIVGVQQRLFGVVRRDRPTTDSIQEIKNRLKNEIYRFIARYDIEVLIPENILAIPMHVPLGLAMTEVIAETGLPTIAHHHDFAWERDRFALNAVGDFLQAAFPPSLHGIEHVVINSMAQKELSRRYGLASTVIPNVLDFETPPPLIDDYNRTFREDIGLSPDDWLILQPTRVVPRKGIEHAIELVRRLDDPRAKLIISHAAGDEGGSYVTLLKERIADAGIDVRFIDDRIAEKRGFVDGRKRFTLMDVYPHANLVTYPSLYEGFGNAFLEAIYFGKPVVVNDYAVYVRDIEPLGFRTIPMSQIVAKSTVTRTREILEHPTEWQESATLNFNLGRQHFSHSVARRKLAARLANLFGEGV